MMGRTTYPKA